MSAPVNNQKRPVVLLRPVPGASPLHRLWAGTKLIAVFAFSALVLFFPGWEPIVVVGVLVALLCAVARVPRGALPSIPWWIWAILALGLITAGLGARPPMVHVGPVELSMGGLQAFSRVTVLAFVLLGLCMLVSWTTNVAEVAPALATIGRPLRLLRLPVDEWAVATALALRAFPLLIDEFRVLYAARKLRPRPKLPSRRARVRWFGFELIDVLVAAIISALRRADEMGDAITARGGTGQISAVPSRPYLRDWISLAIVAALCVGCVLFATGRADLAGRSRPAADTGTSQLTGTAP